MLLGLTGDQARPKLAEYRMIEARVGEFESKQILPIQSSSYRIGRRPIRQVLNKLEDRDPGSPSRGLGRLSTPRKEIRKRFIFIDRSQRVGNS